LLLWLAAVLSLLYRFAVYHLTSARDVHYGKHVRSFAEVKSG
jgi:hypothetical protein